MKRRLAIVLNPDSGSSTTSESIIKKSLNTSHTELKFFDIKEGIDKLVWRIGRYKPHMVVAVGGDGTVNAVAGIAVKLDLPMGVIPDGTLNHFAKDLGLPLTLDEAAAIISTGTMRLIDYAEVNGRVFVNNCNLGGYPEAVLKRDELSLLGSKWLSAAVAFWLTFRQHRKQRYRLMVDGAVRTVGAGSIFIGNNAYNLAGMDLASRDHLDRGKLQLVIVKTGRVRYIIGILIGLARRQYHEKLEVQEAKQIVIESERAVRNVAIDGEVAKLAAPLNVRVHPKGLRVIF